MLLFNTNIPYVALVTAVDDDIVDDVIAFDDVIVDDEAACELDWRVKTT